MKFFSDTIDQSMCNFDIPDRCHFYELKLFLYLNLVSKTKEKFLFLIKTNFSLECCHW